MWSHYCKAERHAMYTEDGKECNWCGETLSDTTDRYPKAKKKTFDVTDEIMNEESISNVEVTDMPDGSAKVTMDIDAVAQKALMKQGLNYLIKEMRMNDKVVVLEPNEFMGGTKTWELDDEEANALFHFGFIDALQMGMKKENM